MAKFLKILEAKFEISYVIILTCLLYCTECNVSINNSTTYGVSLQNYVNNIVHDVSQIDSTDVVTSSKSDTTLAYTHATDYVYEDNHWSDLFSYVQNVDEIISLKDYRFTALSFLFPLNHFTVVKSALNTKIASGDVQMLTKNNALQIHALVLLIQELHTEESCSCFWPSAIIPEFRLDTLASVNPQSQHKNTSIQVGIEYNERVIKCCGETNFDLLSLVNFVVFKLVFSSKEFFSYGFFAKALDENLLLNREFVRNYNSKCSIYIRIVYRNTEDHSHEISNRYKALLAEYVTTWIKETTVEETFIIEVYPLNIKLPSNAEVLQSRVYTHFFDTFKNPKFKSDNFEARVYRETTNVCENKQMISILSQTFKGFQFSPNEEFCLTRSTRLCNNDIPMLINSTTLLFDNYEETSTFHQVEIERLLRENCSKHNLQTIYFSNPNSSWNSLDWNQTVSKLRSKNINIGGYVQFIDFGKSNVTTLNYILEAFSKIRQLFFQASKILLHFRIDLELLYLFLPEVLFGVQTVERLYQKRFTDTIFVTAITLESNPSGVDPPKEGFVTGLLNQPTTVKGALSIYCDKFAKRINELYEAVITHANIHEWKEFHLRNAVSNDGPGSWWLNADTNPEYVDRRITNYPLLVRTNAARLLRKDQQLPMTFPCIEWTTKSIDTGIRFLDNGFIGATVRMAIRKYPLNTTELETMLLYALGKFGSVELLVKSKQDLDNVAAVVLNERFINISHRQNGPLVYVDLPIDLAGEGNVSNYSSDKVFWHFSGWESYKENFSISECFNAVLKNHRGQIGLSVEDCGYEINTNFTRIKNLTILQKISYIICHTKPFVPNNRNPTYMAEYLHTLYYIKHYIETFLPKQVKMVHNFKVHFRLNFNSEQNCRSIAMRDRTENFLRFLNDANQHSSAYQINYFIEAFGNENESYTCSGSWWKLKSYEDLTNISVYVDKEDEHFGRPTKLGLHLPLIFPPVEIVVAKDSVTQTAVLSVVSVLFIVAVVIILLRWWQTRQRYLDKKEIEDFYNGELNNKCTADASKWLGIPFSKSYEIPLSNIELGRLIGSGEFGKVHIGKLNDRLDVAIKVPEPNDSKESFKSALTEVKILCYLANGQHSNVVLFLGACTREIQNGKLYILTEFCTNGSLQDYLRSNQEDCVHSTNHTIELYKLHNFAHEIASGMEYISAKRVVHGDLSARNVFLNADFTCKIGDFGLSRKLYEFNEYVKKSQGPLPWRWMAIESLKHMEFTTKSDVWSFGVTVWEIFSLGNVPFPGLSWNIGFVSDLENGLRLKKARFSTEDIHLKLLSCWYSVSDDRPTFSELVEFFAAKKITEYESF